MTLPKIDWDCSLTVVRPNGSTSRITTTVSAVSTEEAYALCERMARNADYLITSSSIWPKNGNRSVVPYKPEDDHPPWQRPAAWEPAPDKGAEIFESKYWTKTSARPTTEIWREQK